MSIAGKALFDHFQKTYNPDDVYDPCSENHREAMRALQQSADKGYAEAQYMVGITHFANTKFDKAEEWFKKSLEQPHDKHEEAQAYLNTITESTL